MIFRSTSVPNIGANHDSSSQGADGNGPRLTRATSLLDERQMQRIIEDNLVAKQQTPDSFSLGLHLYQVTMSLMMLIVRPTLTKKLVKEKAQAKKKSKRHIVVNLVPREKRKFILV